MHDSVSANESDYNFNLEILLLVWIGSWNMQAIPHIAHALSQWITLLGY